MAMILLLAVFLMPQKAAANGDDFQSSFLFSNYSYNNAGTVEFVVTIFDNTGDDEGFVNGEGVTVSVSKDNGATWMKIAQIKATTNGGNLLSATFFNGARKSKDYWVGNYNRCRVAWNLPLEWRNCRIIYKSEGYWTDDNGQTEESTWRSGTWVENSSYFFSVRNISWNGTPSVSPDGTVTIPYQFGDAQETDGHTGIATRIDGAYNSTIDYHTPSSSYAAGPTLST